MRIAFLHHTEVKQESPGRESNPCRRSVGVHRFERLPAALPGTETTEFAAKVGHCPRRRSIKLIGDHRQYRRIGVHHGVPEDLPEGTRTPFPVQEGSGLLAYNCDRKDYVGEGRDVGVMVLERDDEVDVGQGCRKIRRVVGSFNTPDEGRFDRT